jgi:anti-sigma regulatory factor (Ser/Thr protein kinase)/peptidoglycan biosynthesis protein MviN/MurJ (putative lipid II flippase)
MLTAMMSFVKIDGSPKMPLVCIAVMSSSNIILDFAMVKMGMFGMALATTISYCLALATVFLHFLKKTSSLKLVKPKKLFSETSQMVVTGFPTAISRISDTIKVMLLNNMMVAFVSVAAVTALNVRTQANNFLSAVIIGVGQAATPTISMFFGEEDRTAIKDTLKITLKFGLFMTLLLMMVLFIFPGIFPEIFGVTEPEIMSMASMAIRIFSITIPFTLINTVLMNFYQCTKRTGMATLICLLQSLVYTVLFAFILIRPFGANGIWTAFFLGEVFTLVTVIICIFVKNKKISLTLSSIMMLDKDFGGNENDRLELSIGNSMDEVMTISSGIYKFGKNRDIDDKTLNVLSLCIEEIAGNVVRHSFKEGEKRWLDLIILDRKDHMIIRFRDNGPAFDPVAYLNNDAPKEGYGIPLIHCFADDFEYRYNMGINNTIIHLKKHNIKVK